MELVFRNLHLINMVLVLITSLVAGVWGLILYFRKKTEAITRPWKISLIVAAIFGLLQALLGIILVLLGTRPPSPNGSPYYLHYVYGAIVALAIPVAYTYIGKDVRKATLILSCAAIILALAATRGAMTGLGMP
ncbi:MAG: hypothetical protein ACRDHW_14435 [Ktedonobacteraceae bacterium]